MTWALWDQPPPPPLEGAPASIANTLCPGEMGCWSKSRWFFGTPQLAHPTCFSKPPRVCFTLFPYTFRQPQSLLLERGRRKEVGWGLCCHSGCLRPWHKGLGSRPPSGGGGGGVAAWPRHDLQRPPEKGTWPLPAQNSPSQCPLALEGVKFLSPFFVGPMRSGGHRENVGRRKPGGMVEMGQGLRWRPRGVPEGAAVGGCPAGILETVI